MQTQRHRYFVALTLCGWLALSLGSNTRTSQAQFGLNGENGIEGNRAESPNTKRAGAGSFLSSAGLTVADPCAQWNAWYPAWSLTQSDKTKVFIEPQPGRGNAFAGAAHYTDNYSLARWDGTIEGTAQADNFTMQIYWRNGEVGVYTGKISATGRIEGGAFSKSHPARKVTWFSDTPLQCATEAADTTFQAGVTQKKFFWPAIRAANGETVLLDLCRESAANCGGPAAIAFCKSKGFDTASYSDVADNVGRTANISNGQICSKPRCDGFASILCTGSYLNQGPPPPKVIHTTGRAPVAPAPAPPPETMNVPGINASPNNIALVAGKGAGKTTLTWDGGKNHPNAEVRVKVDDQDETSVVKSGKGTLQVTVVPGKTYVYMLEDAGKVLATVTVKFHR